MANEFQHKDPGSTLTQAEYITTDGTGHIFDCQATGDIMYASSATVLKNLGKGAANTVLSMGGSCIPAWTASPSVTDLTIGGGCITLSAATDIDLLDNNASALSFDASGKTGIIDIVTTNCSEGVTMSGTLGVTGVLTATGGLAGGAICIGSSTITTTGLISGGSLDIDNVLINGTTIGHTCDSDLMTVADACLTIKGAVTVGVDDAGHDVKFFGAAAGAYMLYDFSCDQLEIRGASADAATRTGKLLLTTALPNINACDVIGSINFQAPLEAGSCDAILVAAGIRAVAQATFTCAVNATDLIFYTGHSEAAAERFRFTSQNEIGIAGANYGSDGQVLTSGGAGAAVAWEAAAGGAVAREGGNTTEATTTSTSAADLMAISSLTIAAVTPILFIVNGRKSSGATAGGALGLEVNTTALREATIGGDGLLDLNNTANAAADGMGVAWLGPRVTNYLNAGVGLGHQYTSATGGILTRDQTAMFQDNPAPNAEITVVTVRGISGNGSVTVGADEFHFYSIATS